MPSLNLNTSVDSETDTDTSVSTPVTVGGVSYNPPTSIGVYIVIGVILLAGLYIYKEV